MKKIVVKTSGLTKRYQQHLAVNQVEMTVNQGDIYGFIGENGAGKTTFIRLLTGLIKKSSGDIFLENGEERGNLGAVIEGPACYPYLSAAENIHYFALQQGIRDKQRETEVLEFVGLADTGKKRFKDFSLGMKQRLGIAVAILSRPKFLILDEPINGLDPAGIIEIRQIIQRLNQEHQTTIFISSHILAELSMVATRYGVIQQGRLIREFSQAELHRASQAAIQLDTADNQAALQVLSDHFEVEEVGGKLEIVAANECRRTIGDLLVAQGISVWELSCQESSLEDYFLKITGGMQNV